jgi:hypothetical protein
VAAALPAAAVAAASSTGTAQTVASVAAAVTTAALATAVDAVVAGLRGGSNVATAELLLVQARAVGAVVSAAACHCFEQRTARLGLQQAVDTR